MVEPGGVEEEEQFVAIVIPNEREGVAPSNFVTCSQLDCYEYESEHDNAREGFYKSCVKNYRMANHKPEVLFAMLVGHVDVQSLILEPPFSLAKKKSILQVFQPANATLQREVARRSHFFFLECPNHENSAHPLWNARSQKDVKPRPKQWSRPQLLEWLSNKSTTGFRVPDTEFLDTELVRISALVQRAVEEQEAHEWLASRVRGYPVHGTY